MFDSYFLKILIGTVILGFSAGAVGVFPTQRKQALIGDALSHAALPGVVVAYMLFNTRDIGILLLGAAFASVISMLLIELIKKYSNIKFDASMALILSSFFGLGNVLLSLLTGSGKAGLSKFIFGEAATMLEQDVFIISVASIVAILIVIIFWRHIKLFIFDEDFYTSLGFNTKIVRSILTFLTVLVVVISIRAIGVVLMSALLIAPAVTARIWSNKLSLNFILAGVFGAISAAFGTYFSFKISGLPTGPIIVVVLSVILILTLLFAPKRGIIASSILNKRHKVFINKYHELVHFYEFGDFKDESVISNYLTKGYIKEKSSHNYDLTDKGEELVFNIMRGRNLWD